MSPPSTASAAAGAPPYPAVAGGALPGVVGGRLVRVGTAIVAGVLGFLAFPPVGAWYTEPLAVAGLVLAVRGARLRLAYGLGLVFGVAMLVPLLVWIRPLGSDVWLLLACAEATLVALMGVAAALLVRLRGWPLWIACAWVADEALRARFPLGGFPWGRLGFAEASGPLARYAAVGGVPLISLVVALTGCLLAAAALAVTGGRARRPRWTQAVPLAAGAIALTVAALAVPLPTGGQHTGGPAYATVALVQGNVPRMGLDAFAQRGAVIRNHVAGTLRLADDIRAGRLAKPDIVLWPENATDIDPYADPSVQGVIGAAVAAVGAPTLVGAVILGPGPHHARNAGLVWLPGQVPTVGYVKRQLVPFGEYVPYRSELGSVIGRLRRVAYDLVPGHSAGLVTLGKVRLSDVICYEVAYDQLVRGDVRAGGRMIVVQTNNATYGTTETRQQLAMGRLRAIEHGRAVAVVATSGISAVIAPNGHVVASSGVFTPALLEERVPLRDSMTLADRLAGWPELVLSVAGLLALLVAAAKIRGERRRGGDIGARRVASPLPARLR